MQKLIYSICLFLAVGLAGCDTPLGDAESGTAPCSENLTDNTLTIDGSRLEFNPNNVDYTAPHNGGNFYEYRVSLPSPYRYLYIRLSADKTPTENRTYFVTESSAAESPSAGYAYLSVETEDGVFYYSGESDDNLYVTVKDGVTTFDLCDLDMFHYADYMFGMTGRVVYGTPNASLPCTENLTDNTLTIKETKLTFAPADINYTSPNAGGNFHEFRVSLPSPYRYLYIRLSADKTPTENRTYLVTESSAEQSPKAGYAYLSVETEGGVFYYSGESNDKLYVTVKDGATTFDLCDLDMFHYADYAFGMTGRVVYGKTPQQQLCTEPFSDNALTVNGTKLTFTSGDINYTSPNSSGNFHEFRVNLPSPYRTLYIRLSADKAPTESRTYSITESSAASSPNPGYAYMSVLAADGTFYYTGESNDKLDVIVENGKITFDLCDIDIFYYYTYKFGITGRIAYGTAATTPAPCSASLTSNVLIADGTRLEFSASNVHYASPNGGGNFHEYTVDLPSPYRMLYIRLAADATPTENRSYLITESSAASSPKSGYAYMSVLAADGTFYYTGESNDRLYVTSQNGVITFDLCDIDMFYYYTYKFGLTGRVEYRR